MTTFTISEARFNDMVYLTLKKIFFEFADIQQYGPRECDIRICMNMINPSMITNPLSASILLPNEKAPTSHDKTYKIEKEKILQVCQNYMEDHWFKQPMPNEWNTGWIVDIGNGKNKVSVIDYFNAIIKICLEVSEDQCGPQK